MPFALLQQRRRVDDKIELAIINARPRVRGFDDPVEDRRHALGTERKFQRRKGIVTKRNLRIHQVAIAGVEPRLDTGVFSNRSRNDLPLLLQRLTFGFEQPAMRRTEIKHPAQQEAQPQQIRHENAPQQASRNDVRNPRVSEPIEHWSQRHQETAIERRNNRHRRYCSSPCGRDRRRGSVGIERHSHSAIKAGGGLWPQKP